MNKQTNIMVNMRDNVQLATDIYLPDDGKGSYPVVIERTPYGKHLHSRSEIDANGNKISREEMAQAFTTQGIAVIFQDCRGRYSSQGTFTKYLNEPEDGFDTLSWIIKQPWCNGKIGTMGLSYAAHTQLSMACLNPPGLTTMILDSGGFANAYHCGIRQGGAFELKQATWAYKQAQKSPSINEIAKMALAQENIHEWFKKMPWLPRHSPLRHAPEYETYFFEQWQDGSWHDGWANPAICADGHYENIPDIPILHMSSWYDNYVWSTLHNYHALKQSKTAPQSLIMGPWLHGDRIIPYSGDAHFGEAAIFDYSLGNDWLNYRLQWMIDYLRDSNPRPPQTALYLMGGGTGNKRPDGKLDHGGKWLFADQYPLPNSQIETWHLHGNMQLSQKVAETAEIRFHSDPSHPIPTIGGSLTSGKPIYHGGGFDQRETSDIFGADGTGHPINARQDVLSFQTEPLTEELIIAGEIQLKIHFTTNVPDCDITAKLIDEYPPNSDYPHGYALNLTDGIMRARYRNDWANPQAIEEGETVTLTVQPFDTCAVIAKGHRLRLDIAGSNFPHFDVNPNSYEPEGQARHPRIAKHCVQLGQGKTTLQMRVLHIKN